MNIIKSQHESVLKLEKLMFTNINFTRGTETPDCDKLKMRIGKKIDWLDADHIDVTLLIKIWAPDQELDLEVTAFANFYFKSGSEISHELKKDICETNTISIMFPYIRSQVSLVTTQPDMSPIVIPSLNINSLMEKDDD